MFKAGSEKNASALTLDGVDVMGERLASEVNQASSSLFPSFIVSDTLCFASLRSLKLFNRGQTSVEFPLFRILWEGLPQDMQLGSCTSHLISKTLLQGIVVKGLPKAQYVA